MRFLEGFYVDGVGFSVSQVLWVLGCSDGVWGFGSLGPRGLKP